MPYFIPKENFSSLTPEGLMHELDPDQICLNLRWAQDIVYQKAVAEAIESKLAAILSTLDLFSRGDLLRKLGTAFMEGGMYDKAEDYYRQANDLAKGMPNEFLSRRLQAQCIFGLAVTQRELHKNPEEALQLFKRTREILRSLSKGDAIVGKLYSDIQRNEGIAYLVIGTKDPAAYSTAETVFQQGVDLAHAAESLNRLPLTNYLALARARQAEHISDLGDKQKLIAQAAEAFDQVRTLYTDYASTHRVDLIEGCNDWGSHVYHSALGASIGGDYRKAAGLFEESYRIRLKLNLQGQNLNRIADVLADWARALEANNEIAAAKDKFVEARSVYGEMPKPTPGKIDELNIKIAQLGEVLASAAGATATFTLKPS